jgi:hypothetical protein
LASPRSKRRIAREQFRMFPAMSEMHAPAGATGNHRGGAGGRGRGIGRRGRTVWGTGAVRLPASSMNRSATHGARAARQAGMADLMERQGVTRSMHHARRKRLSRRGAFTAEKSEGLERKSPLNAVEGRHEGERGRPAPVFHPRNRRHPRSKFAAGSGARVGGAVRGAVADHVGEPRVMSGRTMHGAKTVALRRMNRQRKTDESGGSMIVLRSKSPSPQPSPGVPGEGATTVHGEDWTACGGGWIRGADVWWNGVCQH